MPNLTKRLAAPPLALLLAASPAAAQGTNPNVRFGLPSPAKPDPRQREDYLIARPQYVLSYNAEKRTPNWVCWRLTKGDLGSAARAPFEPDPDLPRGMAKVTPHDYDGSGFDRGHMCNAHDRSRSADDIRATFYMTNMVPQSPSSNQKGWARLEDYCRRLAQQGHVLYIVCGPHGVGGEGKNGRRDEVGRGRLKVTVPNKLWKVILVLPREDAEPRRNSRVIAVLMPNDQGVGYDWAKYRVSPRRVERLTGHVFFRDVPAEVAAALKDRVDDVEVRVPSSRPGRGGHAEGPVPKVGKGGGEVPDWKPGCIVGNRR